jgi:iron complex transport system substrate-binding protein
LIFLPLREVTASVFVVKENYNQMRKHVISSRFPWFLLLSCLILLAACGQSAGTTPTSSVTVPTATPALDVYGTPIAMPKSAPQRIIALVPNISEILGALNLDSRVVAVDYYTTYPADLTKRPRISNASGTFNTEQILALKPDLVLSDGGTTAKYDTQLSDLGLNVVDLPDANFDQAIQQIAVVGRITYTQDAATKLVSQLQQEVAQIKATVAGTPAPKVLLEVDDSTAGKPYVFGGNSFGDQLLQYANAVNIFHTNTSNGGYPQVTDEAIISANPNYIILTEDPLYGGQPSTVYSRPNWGNIDAVKNHRVYHINTNLMQHPSQRLVEGLRCVAQVVHPDKFSGALPTDCSASV